MEPISTAQALLLVSLALLGYSYVGYPALLWLLGRCVRREAAAASDPSAWPTVSIVIAAHNEEQVIGRRIDNLLSLDYPPAHLQILIGSDGSTDRTSEIVRLYRRPRIEFHDFALQRGKAQVLNDLVAQARGKYIVFTDANTFFEPDAVKELIKGFRLAPSTCAVVGKLEFRTSTGGMRRCSRPWNPGSVPCSGRMAPSMPSNGHGSVSCRPARSSMIFSFRC